MSATDPKSDPLPGLLGHCQKLYRTVTDRVMAWRERDQPFANTTANVLLNVFYARSSRTYQAIVEHLGERGFGEQGAMLNRSLWEDMVDARWVSLNPELADERLRQHHRYSEQLRLDTAKRFEDFFGEDIADKELDPPMDDVERGALRKHFGRWGTGSWTGRDLHERFREILPTWQDTRQRRQAEFVFAWLHQLNNETLHPTAYSLGKLGGPSSIGNELHFRLGSTQHLLKEVLWFAFWTYTQTVALLFEFFELDGWEEIHREVVVPGLGAFAEASSPEPGPTE
jgi:hypothetical protein